MSEAANTYLDRTFSAREPRSEAACLIDVLPEDEITMSVLVRRKPDALRLPDSVHLVETAEEDRQYLPRKEFAKAFGEFDADMEYVAQFGRQHGLTVLESSPQRRTVVLKGTAEQMLRFAQDESRMSLSTRPA